MELGNLRLRPCSHVLGFPLLVLTAVPAVIVVDGVADVVARDGVGLVVGIARLPARAGNPDDAREAVAANLVVDGLEVVVHGFLASSTIVIIGISRIDNTHGLVGQFKANLPGILAHRVVLAYQVPHLYEVLLVVVAHHQVAGAHPGRAHHHVHAVLDGVEHQGHVERLQKRGQLRRVEVADVGLASPLRVLVHGRLVRVAVVAAGPCRVQVQAEHVALGLLQAREQFCEVFPAVGGSRLVVAARPAVVVEPHTRCVHHTMQHDVVAVRVNQPLAFHVDGG